MQEVTDAEGRRRFHGAFTGGYSAGYYNTVGSLEGWNPSAYNSSREERTKQRWAPPSDLTAIHLQSTPGIKAVMPLDWYKHEDTCNRVSKSVACANKYDEC